jgi:signal transduction histidine kinase
VDDVHVTLEQLGPRVRLSVTDAGAGFDAALLDGDTKRARRRFGLISMRERAAAIGAELSLTTRPGGGTRVEVVA